MSLRIIIMTKRGVGVTNLLSSSDYAIPPPPYGRISNINRRGSNFVLRILLVALITCALLSYYYYRFVMFLTTTTAVSSPSSVPHNPQFDIDDGPLLPFQTKHKDPKRHQQQQQQQQQYPIDEAQFIIHKSYAESYGRMMKCDETSIERDCIKLVIDDIMMKNQQQQQQQQQGNTTHTNIDIASNEDIMPYPWWYTTLLRDILTNGAYGPWHHFSTRSTNPPIRFCAIGKNACTEWRRVFKALNAPEFCNTGNTNQANAKDDSSECKSQFNTATPLSQDPTAVPNAVFIRDPLERLLSAYLDKCTKPNIRKTQGHCEPNSIFGADYLKRTAKNSNGGNNIVQIQQHQTQEEQSSSDEMTNAIPDLRRTLQKSEKELFAAYVDLLPLKWNVHFVPQAITCDLYRNIHTYDFVGIMGKQFMSELERMVHRYGGGGEDASSSSSSSSSSLVASVLNDTFQYQSKLQNESIAKMNLGSDNTHGTRAPSKVSKYFSARSVRRALEYLSIDYVTFGLEVPDWATEMLWNDQ